MKKILLVGALALSTFSAFAIDLATYRKIDSPGMDAGKVLLLAGEPDARERNGSCMKFMYRGTDSALAGKIVTVVLCGNKVVKASAD